MTDEERKLVIGWLREYPAGISGNSWGTGPFQIGPEFDEAEDTIPFPESREDAMGHG